MSAASDQPKPPELLYSGFDLLTGGMDAGIAPISIPQNKVAYALNCTFRGGYVTNRPPFSQIALNLDAGVNLTGMIPQGACYYSPDFGQQSIVAQMGGRLYQFVIAEDGSAYVYDRTIKVYPGGSSFQFEYAQTNSTTTTTTTSTYVVFVTNINDGSGASYPPGTVLYSDPSYIAPISIASNIVYTPPVGGGPVIYNGTITFPASYVIPLGFVGNNKILINYSPPGNNLVTPSAQWNVLAVYGQTATIRLTASSTGQFASSNFTIPAGTTISYVIAPSPQQSLTKMTQQLIAPVVGGSSPVYITTAYPGSVGDVITIGNGQYTVTNFQTINQVNTSTTGGTSVNQTVAQSNSQVFGFTYDPNPSTLNQAWLWQTENYVVVQNGFNRPVFFDGIASRRSITATYQGLTAGPFVLPRNGEPASILLSTPFTDAVGTFINLAPIGLYPLLMQVVATNVGGSQFVIEAVNVTGQSSTGQTVPLGTPINSTASPSYSGIITTGIAAMPAQGSPVTLALSPPFNGAVGDTILLTDGTGSNTSYEFLVTSIQAGGTIIIATNVSAPLNLILNAGYPVISENTVPNELPIGRMGAYVQGRNWISNVNGNAFIASDQVGDSSGTAQVNSRDAVLKWSINTTQFSVPGGAGKINCIIALSSLDASLGQGPLQILCDNDIFTCSAPNNSTQWATVTTPILSESAIGFGGCGQDAAQVVNGDLIVKSTDASIHSFQLVREDFEKWGIFPISQELNPLIKQENTELIEYADFQEADNRCLMGALPYETSGVIYSQGLYALDYDVASSLQEKLPAVYDGVWKGLNFMKIIGGVFGRRQRVFFLAWNFTSNQPELWEVLIDGTEDNSLTAPIPITWAFETGVFFGSDKDKYQPKRLESGEIYISNLVGSATITAWYRPDFDQCWHAWSTITVCADNLANNPAVLDVDQYRMRLGLGKPTAFDVDPTVGKKAQDGRFFQVRIQVTGSLTVMGGIVTCSNQTQPLYATIPAPEGPLPS